MHLVFFFPSKGRWVRLQQWFSWGLGMAGLLTVAKKCVIQIISPTPRALIYYIWSQSKGFYMHMSQYPISPLFALLVHLDLIAISQQSPWNLVKLPVATIIWGVLYNLMLLTRAALLSWSLCLTGHICLHPFWPKTACPDNYFQAELLHDGRVEAHGSPIAILGKGMGAM